VFAVPQDGISMPADFNASTSVYLKSAWNGTTTDIKAGTWTLGTQGTNTCSVSTPCTCGDGLNNNPAVCKVPLATLTLDAATGYYTVKLNTVVVPDTATMLTGGLGYSYNLSSSQPMTQINLPAYPYNSTTKVGGLIVAAPNVWLPAKNTNITTGTIKTGYQGTQLCAEKECTCTTAAPCVQWAPRRNIVDNGACLKCHSQLGAAPSFHAAQRNDGPSCSWCHTPNRTSSAWSANSKDFIHAIHGARKREVPFTWHALSATQNFGEVEFPGQINECTACHVAGGFDFSTTTGKAALPRLLPSTVGQGKYNADPLTNSTYYTLSPYVMADNVTDYGTGFSFTAATGVTKEAADTTLVVSPITAACSACHDSSASIDHMQANGGRFYDTRANYKAKGALKEQCMICHATGKVAPIATVHK
jgi:OmcA/MtrC family decaheme c-type cytochrome